MRKTFIIAVLMFVLGGAALAVSQDLEVSGYLNVKGVTTLEAEITASGGIKAAGGTVEASYFLGSGAQLTDIEISNAATGEVFTADSGMDVTGTVTADAFVGDGSGLTGITAVLTFASQEAAQLTGNVDIKAGTNVTITQAGQTLEVAATAGIGPITAMAFLAPETRLAVNNVGTTYRDFDAAEEVGYAQYDFTGATQARIVVYLQDDFAAGTGYVQIYNITGASQVCEVTIASATPGIHAGNWTAVSLGDVALKIQARSTVATDDPSFLNCYLQIR